jgi:di/tricarboxylate transporter
VIASLDYTSFFNVWYWVLTIATWTQVCHRTLGVPYDMILRAERLPSVAEEVDSVARIAASRIAAVHRTLGSAIAAAGGFVLAALGVLGILSAVEAALAAFLLLMPLSVVLLQTARLALFIDRTDARGVDLRRRLARRRAWNQAIAIAATMVAVVVALLHHPAAALVRW